MEQALMDKPTDKATMEKLESMPKGDLIETLVKAKQSMASAGSDKKKAATALNTIANVNIAMSEPREALKSATAALKLANEAGDKKIKAAVLCTVAKASAGRSDYEGALKAGTEMLALFRELKVKTGEAGALGLVARLFIARGFPKAALKAAEKCLAIEAKNEDGLIAMADAQAADDKPDEAMKHAKNLLELYKSQNKKAGQAEALIMIAKVNPREGAASAKEAANLFGELGKTKEKAAALELATSCEKQAATPAPKTSKVLVDDKGIALVEMDETATTEALTGIITALQGMIGKVKCIVLVVTGVSAAEPSGMLKNGAFYAGLRSVGAPMVGVGIGKQITGHSWTLVMMCDYKMCSVESTFVLPLDAPVQILKKLVSSSHVAEIAMKNGPMSALQMVEVGLMNMAQPGAAATKAAALEFSERALSCPGAARLMSGLDHVEAATGKPPARGRAITTGYA